MALPAGLHAAAQTDEEEQLAIAMAINASLADVNGGRQGSL
jgi:hypothetical protein